MAAKNKIAPIFSRKVFFEANFILHMEKIQKIKISLFNKIQYGAKNNVALTFSRKVFFDS